MKIALTILSSSGEMYLRDTIGNFLPYVDEVKVAIDSKCNDKSREILKEMNIEFQEFKWEHHYSKAKNFLIGLVSKDIDWIIELGEDTKLSPEDCKKLIDYIKTVPEDVGGINLPMKHHSPDWTCDEENYILKQFYPQYHCCIVRNYPGLQWEGRVHETPHWNVIRHGYKVIDYGEVNRHHHAFRGDEKFARYWTHLYYLALSQLPEDWNIGDQLPEFDETRGTIPEEIRKYLLTGDYSELLAKKEN